MTARRVSGEPLGETRAQGKQREITLESLAVLKVRRPDVQVFNDLSMSYVQPDRRNQKEVVPDQLVVLSDEPVEPINTYEFSKELARPFWVLDYVCDANKRKDYEDSFNKYERDLKVPYYLIFYPDNQELTLYRHNGKKYVSVKPNKDGRHPIPDLDLEVGLLGGWVRFWHQGELLPLPADLQRDLDDARRRTDEEKRRADLEQRRAEQEKRRADDLQRELEAEREARRAAENALAQLRAVQDRPPTRRSNGTKA